MVPAVAVGDRDVVSADPEALRVVRQVGVEASWELTRLGRRLGLVLVAADVGLPAWARDLGDELVALAAEWEALDRWAGAVGDAVAGADVVGLAPAAGPGRTVAAASVAAFVEPAPTWVDGLTDEEAEAAVLAAARQLRAHAPFLMGAQRATIREQLAPLVRRVRRRWPDAALVRPDSCVGGRATPKGLDDALDLLALTGPGRTPRVAGLAAGFVSGFANGAGDTEGYDNLGSEVARTVGHLASSVLVVGDVRDAGVEAARGNGWGVLAAGAAAIPGAGDAFKAAKSIDEAADAAGDLRKLDPSFRYPTSGAELRTLLRTDLVPGGGLHIHEMLKGHTISKHVGRTDEQLAQRLADEPMRTRVSTFSDRVEAEAAIAYAMEELRPQIEALVRAGEGQVKKFVPTPSDVGQVLPRGAGGTLPGRGVFVIIRPLAGSALGYKLVTAYPEVP